MYHACKLVHADLSEYNIIYHAAALHIIDVSQSVEHDHPNAYDFLRADLRNVEEFFGRYGAQCLGLRRAFEFVTRETIEVNGRVLSEAAEWEDAVRHWVEHDASASDMAGDPDADAEGAQSASSGAPEQPSSESRAAHEDSVFMRSYIPRTLNEVYDPERDVAAVQRGEGGTLIYAKTIGLVEDGEAGEAGERAGKKPGGRFVGADVDEEADASTESEDDSEDESQGSDENPDAAKMDRKPRGHRHEDKEAKKVRLLIFWITHTHHKSLPAHLPGAKESRQGRSARTQETQASQSREEEESQVVETLSADQSIM